MAFDVRIFGHRGVQQLPVMLPQQFSSDAIYQLVYPYEFAQKLTTNGLVPVTSLADAGVNTMFLRVEVPDSSAIRFEINPPGRAIAAGPSSPKLSGINQLYFRNGWTFSLIDALGAP